MAYASKGGNKGVKLFWPTGFGERDFDRLFSIHFHVKIQPPLPPPFKPHSILGDHNLNKVESILPKGASTQVSAFLASFCEVDFLRSQQFFENSHLSPFEKELSPSF